MCSSPPSEGGECRLGVGCWPASGGDTDRSAMTAEWQNEGMGGRQINDMGSMARTKCSGFVC